MSAATQQVPTAKKLRPYQSQIVREISGLYLSGTQGILMQSVTGSGKTRTATYIVEQYAKTGRQVLWLVHREELLMQAAMTFAEAGIEHRLICADSSARAIKVQQFREMGKSWVTPTANVVIASIQTIVRRLDRLDWLHPAQIVSDEAHLSLAKTWREVIGKWPMARLLGLTATPSRLDRQSFARSEGGLYDAMVRGPEPAALIEWGNLARYKVYAPPVHFREGVTLHHKGGDWDTKDLEKEFDTPVIYGDVIGHYEKLSKGKPAIAFCPTVKVAEDFAEAFRRAGYRAIALDGNTDDAIRRRSLQQLGRGELDVVTSVSILVEGTDVPYATTALLLRRTESLSLYLQAVGRVMRPHPEKEFALILDFVGVTAIHGFPDDEREWSLTGEVRRSKAANDNMPDVKVTTCTKCFAIHSPAPVCPCCGFVYPVRQRKEIEQVEGTLEEKTNEIRDQMRRAQRVLQGKAQTVEELMHTMGMSRSRATKIVQARAEKQQLIDGILADLSALQADTGGNVWANFSVSISSVRSMKPKALKELAARISAEIPGRQDLVVRVA